MRSAFLAVAVAGLMMSGCAAVDAPAAGDLTPEDRAGYVAMAGSSDLYEIESSRLALSQAQRPELRQFAQMLITHHTQTTATLMQAAQASGMTPPAPVLLPMHREMMEELQRAPASSFDQVYARQQVPAHEMALALHRNYTAEGDTPALRTAASSAVPIVQGHLEQARQLD
jgi:putative membrane protein